ncbi:hypothetical protein K457DRAFT_487043 [Linnemannia elongata AG-77]|uniref:Uncharacterized protein n=1 Tax=Linnemannia elongata AG-77 TaxID=1314771 RepID=A0A197JX38_9FUNG|nr:hypothetical protein K457DRAFT_487043 [Linnemannia elongata AG-77]
MPDGKRFKLVLPLFQPIEPAGSSFEVLGTKVEITMKKGKLNILQLYFLQVLITLRHLMIGNGISWATLEPSEGAKCWTTFGTTGGAGTVGSKVMHLATDSPLYAEK